MSLAIGLKEVDEFKGMKEKEKLVMDGENVDGEGFMILGTPLTGNGPSNPQHFVRRASKLLHKVEKICEQCSLFP